MNVNGEIEHLFYRKPIANRHTIMKTSAMEHSQKMKTLSQECFRRLHNTGDNVSESKKLDILNEFMADLKSSGYSENERLIILNSGINTYRNLKHQESSGKRPFYRDCEYKNKHEVSHLKAQKKSSWYKKGKFGSSYVSVMYVEATPDDQLIKMLRKTEHDHRISDSQRIKFVSKSGVKLVNLLQRKDPFQENCKISCKPCEYATSKGVLSNCHRSSVYYKAQCVNCDKEGKARIYHGETARNVHVRSKEHVSDLNHKRERSWMWKHIQSEHKTEQPQDITFSWKVSGTLRKPLERQLTEAVNISRAPANTNLNSKGEYNSHSVKRLKIQTNAQEFQCNECSAKFETKNDLRYHYEINHMRIICESCDYEAFGKRDYEYHNKSSHQK